MIKDEDDTEAQAVADNTEAGEEGSPLYTSYWSDKDRMERHLAHVEPMTDEERARYGFGAPVDPERIRRHNEYVTNLRRLRGVKPRDLDH